MLFPICLFCLMIVLFLHYLSLSFSLLYDTVFPSLTDLLSTISPSLISIWNSVHPSFQYYLHFIFFPPNSLSLPPSDTASLWLLPLSLNIISCSCSIVLFTIFPCLSWVYIIHLFQSSCLSLSHIIGAFLSLLFSFYPFSLLSQFMVAQPPILRRHSCPGNTCHNRSQQTALQCKSYYQTDWLQKIFGSFHWLHNFCFFKQVVRLLNSLQFV